MLSSYVTGLAAVVGVTLAWVAVQGAWRRAFPEAGSDPDPLAGRMGCHGCAGSDCDGGHCMTEHRLTKQRKTEHRLAEQRLTKQRKTEHRLAEQRPLGHHRIEHDGRIDAAVEEIP